MYLGPRRDGCSCSDYRLLLKVHVKLNYRYATNGINSSQSLTCPVTENNFIHPLTRPPSLQPCPTILPRSPPPKKSPAPLLSLVSLNPLPFYLSPLPSLQSAPLLFPSNPNPLPSISFSKPPTNPPPSHPSRPRQKNPLPRSLHPRLFRLRRLHHHPRHRALHPPPHHLRLPDRKSRFRHLFLFFPHQI